MRSFLIGLATGLAFYTLYIKTQKKRDDARTRQIEENEKQLLFDAPVSRKCECQDQHVCTCGRHLI